jgi:hypothetical protein
MLVFSPALAATIGLEEAILLYQLHDLGATRTDARDGWCRVDTETLERLLPFWSATELQRIAASLADKGIVQIELALRAGQGAQWSFNLSGDSTPAPRVDTSAPRADTNAQRTNSYPIAHAARPQVEARSGERLPQGADTARAPAAVPAGATLLADDWQPQEDTLNLLALKNIPRRFAIDQLEEFILYWRERGKAEYAWDNRFRKHVIERWQRGLQVAAADEQPPATLDTVWYPSVDALQILERTGINREFIEDTIPEFVLYWRERGDNTGTWNSKFIAHIRRQWARYSNALEHDQEPRPIALNWQPSEDVYDILRMANIDIQFACELLPEFILFWRDAGTPQRSWNTKFLQHIKYQWATRHHLTGANRAGHSLAAGGGAQPTLSTFEQLTDRSWAVGLVDGI